LVPWGGVESGGQSFGARLGRRAKGGSEHVGGEQSGVDELAAERVGARLRGLRGLRGGGERRSERVSENGGKGASVDEVATFRSPADRERHLKDYSHLVAAIDRGELPQVVFYKPTGVLNQHPGYADILSGDEHVAALIARIKQSPLWSSTAIIVTYDENGGFWDHVAPPKGDRWGPGSRIPAIIVSPYAKRGYVDHTSYDTTSILKFITRRFDLAPLPGVRAGAGDLTNAFEFGR
jgi:hypothetical protein